MATGPLITLVAGSILMVGCAAAQVLDMGTVWPGSILGAVMMVIALVTEHG